MCMMAALLTSASIAPKHSTHCPTSAAASSHFAIDPMYGSALPPDARISATTPCAPSRSMSLTTTAAPAAAAARA